MKITTYVELTPAQEETLNGLEKVEVRTSLLKPSVVATVKTFQAQEIKLTIDANGIVEKVWIEEKS